MPAIHFTHRVPTGHDMRVIRPHSRHRGSPSDSKPSRGLVIVAHLVALLSVGAVVTGLTLLSIVTAKRCLVSGATPGLAATGPADDVRSRTGSAGAPAKPPR